MRWSNEMFYILLLNSFAGAIAYGFWMIAKKRYGEEEKIEICVSDARNCGSFFHFSGNVCLSESIYACSWKSWIILWNFIFADTIHLYGRMFDGRDMDSRYDILFRKLYQGILEI